jgi:PAS domain-containing protein
MSTAMKEGEPYRVGQVLSNVQMGARCTSSCSTFFNSSGKVTGALSVLTDIKAKATQKALEMRNKELADYKYALDETSIVGITEQNGIILYANENFCKISKYDPEELIGQNHKLSTLIIILKNT